MNKDVLRVEERNGEASSNWSCNKYNLNATKMIQNDVRKIIKYRD